MARGQAQYLRIFDGGATYLRAQNFWVNSSVTRAGNVWSWLPFDFDGYVEGSSGDEGGVSITLPATALVMEELTTALREARLVEVSTYEFDVLDDGADVGPVGGDLIASFVGELVGAGGGFESITLELGSSLSPIGAQVPPRTFSTRLVGVPCRL